MMLEGIDKEDSSEMMQISLDNIKQEQKDDLIRYDENFGYSDEHGKMIDTFMSGGAEQHQYQLQVPSAEASVTDGVDVDWLSSFFDDGDPLNQCRMDQDSMEGLESCSSLMGGSSTDTFSPNQCGKGNSINNDSFLDSFSAFNEDFISTSTSISPCDTELDIRLSPINSLKRSAPSSPSGGGGNTLRNNNPLLSQGDIDLNLKHNTTVKIEDVKVEPIQTSADLCETMDTSSSSSVVVSPVPKTVGNTTTTSTTKQHQLVPVQVHQKQNQQKLLLFMNTPENRAKLAGTNYNIINANILSKLQAPVTAGGNNNGLTVSSNAPTAGLLNKPAVTIGASSYCGTSPSNVLSLKNCIKVGNTVIKEEPDSPPRHQMSAGTALNMNLTMLNRPADIHGFSTDRNGNRLGLLLKRDQRVGSGTLSPPSMVNNIGYNTNENTDSGYDSASHSSSSSPGSPQIDVESHDDRGYLETLQHVDIPPSERQPFFLSPEERRTLLVEGLPVPSGLPLSKSEERALKKVRRKIKNKISAQESRRKKKEYMECLEKKVEIFASENSSLKKKMTSLEVANRSLIMQVQKLQVLVNNQQNNQQTNTQLKQNNLIRAIENDGKD